MNKDSIRSNCKRVAATLTNEDEIHTWIGVIEESIISRLDYGEWGEKFEAHLDQQVTKPRSSGMSHTVLCSLILVVFSLLRIDSIGVLC
mmetsp:Transcript_2871/g.7809  ORF Transcript_2871/g.7809 Transcript_2871/m.7809 type:complete len:89 (+) Transcript_2871:745-1011(+)